MNVRRNNRRVPQCTCPVGACVSDSTDGEGARALRGTEFAAQNHGEVGFGFSAEFRFGQRVNNGIDDRLEIVELSHPGDRGQDARMVNENRRDVRDEEEESDDNTHAENAL